jgi:hypothetical protein
MAADWREYLGPVHIYQNGIQAEIELGVTCLIFMLTDLGMI